MSCPVEGSHRHLGLDADPWEFDQLSIIPEGEHLEFDPARIFNVDIGADANAALQMLVDSGHVLFWHRWHPRPARKIWGVAVLSQRARRAATSPVESAMHFGLKVRGSRELGLRMSRETYARINKRSSLQRWCREEDPDLWDAIDDRYEDPEHRIYTDVWCSFLQEQALANYDLNMAHFASLDPVEFEDALQAATASQPGMTEITDLTKWDGVPGLYVMVLDEYRQAYVGATNASVGVMKRIKQHWTGAKPLDRLIWLEPRTSILSIDSFRALAGRRCWTLASPAIAIHIALPLRYRNRRFGHNESPASQSFNGIRGLRSGGDGGI